jgi:hypothetical protein
MFKFAEKGKRYLEAVDKYQDIIARNVSENLYKRHIRPLFLEGRRLNFTVVFPSILIFTTI